MLLAQYMRRLILVMRHRKKDVLPKKLILGRVKFRIASTGEIVLGENFSCRENVIFNVSGQLVIGNNAFISDDTKINVRKKVSIGNGVMIGQGVLIYDHDHDYRKGHIAMHDNFLEREVQIGNDVWIGSGTIILKGANIGDRCVIGAGTIVKGIIPEDSIVYDKRDNQIQSIIGKEKF